MNFKCKQKLVKAFLKKSKRTGRNLLVGTVGATSLLGALSVSGNALTNVALQTVQASTQKSKMGKTAKIAKKTYVYNSKGKRISKKSLKKNKTVKVYGTEVIKGKTYYNLGHGRYVLAKNVKTAQTVEVTKKVYVYNSQGKRISSKALKKGKSLKVYGTKTIKGKKYYSLGNGSYVPVINVKMAEPAPTPTPTPAPVPVPPTGNSSNGQTSPAKQNNANPTGSNSNSTPGNPSANNQPTGGGQQPAQPNKPDQPVTPPNDNNGHTNFQENQCTFSYDKDTKTLHIKAGAQGNQLGTGDVIGQAKKAGKVPKDEGSVRISIDSEIVAPVDSGGLFSDSADISGLTNLDTSKTTDMVAMFLDSKATSLDLSKFDTSKVTNMDTMFKDCPNLTSLNLSQWNTSKVDYMDYMFSNDSKLQTITGLNSFDTSNVKNMKAMFNADSKLTKLDLSSFNTKNVTDMTYMFWGDTGLSSLDLSKFAIDSKTNADHMIDYVKATLTKPHSGTIATTDPKYQSLGFNNNYDLLYERATKTLHIVAAKGLDDPILAGGSYDQINSTKDITSISSDDIEHISIDSPIKLHSDGGNSVFVGFKNAKDIQGLDKVDTSETTDLSNMFGGDKSLTSLDLSKFDTSKVTDMSNMFYGCSSLTSLDLSKFDTSNVTDMTQMFSGCSGLTSLDLSKFDTSKVTDMKYMFGGCSGLTSLDLSKWNTSKVTDMSDMFRDCSGLTSLDLSKFDTSNVTDMRAMFEDCSGLTSLDLSKFDTSNVTDMRAMFEDCSGLTSLDLSKWNTSKVTDMSDMFNGCSSLTEIKTKNNDPRNDLGNTNTDKGGMFEGTHI